MLGNVGYIRSIYPRLQKLISVIADKVDERGLVTLEGLWAMDSDYYNKSRSGSTTKNNAVYVIALQRMTLVAEALDDLASAEDYRKRAERVRAAVNERLFNKTTELYDASENNRDIVSEDANAFALLADFPSSIGQRKTILRRLHALKSPGGYLSFDKESGYMETPVVSPIMNGWHAEAALQVGDLDNFNDAIDIWRSCWGPMVDQNTPYYSGCHWEFTTPSGKPYMEHFCSLAHPFSSLPVYSLGVYALGLFPTRPGWSRFDFSPHIGFLETLEFARGRVPTPRGGVIVASWTKGGDASWSVCIEVPSGCSGRISWPRDAEGRQARYQGIKGEGELEVQGPGSLVINIRYL